MGGQRKAASFVVTRRRQEEGLWCIDACCSVLSPSIVGKAEALPLSWP